ncbi:MAG: hypothetical protein P8X42_15665 [Calditrichaceae bacterium]|jgi:hypothetical protein
MYFKFILIFVFVTMSASFGNERTSDFAEAKQLSIKYEKPILIDFMTDW